MLRNRSHCLSRNRSHLSRRCHGDEVREGDGEKVVKEIEWRSRTLGLTRRDQCPGDGFPGDVIVSRSEEKGGEVEGNESQGKGTG